MQLDRNLAEQQSKAAGEEGDALFAKEAAKMAADGEEGEV